MATLTATRGVTAVTGNDSFGAFYERERVPLYRALAFALADRELAAEAVDEAMARAYAGWRKVGGYDNPAGWVYRVALNWARSAFRKRRRESAEPVPDRGERDGEPADVALWRAVASLSENHRDVIVLRFQLDWSLEQIAVALDLPLGTVKSRQHRGLEQLREQLEVTR